MKFGTFGITLQSCLNPAYHVFGRRERRVQDCSLAQLLGPGAQLMQVEQDGHRTHGPAPEEQLLHVLLFLQVLHQHLQLFSLLEAERRVLALRVAVAGKLNDAQSEVCGDDVEQDGAFEAVA